MSTRVLDSFTSPWQADASGRWTLSCTPAAARYGGDGLGMEIVSGAGPAAAPAPYAERRFTPPLDLTGEDELRFWLRSSRAGDGSTARPLYLSFEASRHPPTGTPWRRLLPVERAREWELQRLWIGDMPASLRGSVAYLRLRSLDGEVAFSAAVDDLIATRPAAVADADAAFAGRLHNRFSTDGAAPQLVPAILDVPENPGTRAAPHILITPWSLLMLGQRGTAGDVVDNPTLTGAHTRPAPVSLQLEYRIDVYADTRAEKSTVLDAVVADLLQPLVVNGVAVPLEPFLDGGDPGRTPLYYRLVLPVETGPRRYHDSAQPFLLVGHLPDRSEREAIRV